MKIYFSDSTKQALLNALVESYKVHMAACQCDKSDCANCIHYYSENLSRNTIESVTTASRHPNFLILSDRSQSSYQL